jgi:uncharacterized repeat protein (TIGR03943 family)
MRTTWSVPRIVTGIALAMWAATFWFVIAADRVPYYFSARTTWLAPAGAVTLTAAAVARFLSARVPTPEPVTRKQLQTIVVLVLPAVVISSLPPATLGSFAAARRSGAPNGAYVSLSERDISEGDLSLVDIFELTYNGQLERLSTRAGETSSFTGFVTKNPGDAAGEFRLNRFMISCCPGDAVHIQLRIVGAPPGRVQTDDWVRVTGRIYPVGEEVIVDTTKLERVARPQHPYLNTR